MSWVLQGNDVPENTYWIQYVSDSAMSLRRRLISLLRRSATSGPVRCPTIPISRTLTAWNHVIENAADADPVVDRLFHGITSGNRAALAKGITLVESVNQKKQALGTLRFIDFVQACSVCLLDCPQAPKCQLK